MIVIKLVREPEAVTRLGVAMLVSRTIRRLVGGRRIDSTVFAHTTVAYLIAEHTDAANDRHYELPPRLFQNFLGPRLKYCCCLFANEGDTLAEASAMLA
jgi:cyclopropane-fatty-acyl-phospholipid synthase